MILFLLIFDQRDKYTNIFIQSNGDILETSLPKPYRIIPPGSIVTRDYRIDRLNVHTTEEKDGKYTIKDITFG